MSTAKIVQVGRVIGGTPDQFRGAVNANMKPAFDLDDDRVITSISPDLKLVKSNVLDNNTGELVTYKEMSTVPTVVDGVIFALSQGKYYQRVLKEYKLEDFGISSENNSNLNAQIFNFAQDVIPADSKITLRNGTYKMGNINITKSGVYDFSGVTFINDIEDEVPGLSALPEVNEVDLIGLNLKYTGPFYSASEDLYPSGYEIGPEKDGFKLDCQNIKMINCSAKNFSGTGFHGSSLTAQPGRKMYLINCVSENNGSSGVISSYRDFQMFGGSASENGGGRGIATLSVGGGYGVYFCPWNRPDSSGKIIGVNTVLNMRRNIDTHRGWDMIIANNYCADPGRPHAQWFGLVQPQANNIRLTNIAKRIIVSNNVIKRATFAGVQFGLTIQESTPEEYGASDLIITGNIFEDNGVQIYINPSKTKNIHILGNIGITTGTTESHVSLERDIYVSEVVSKEFHYLENLIAVGNTFDRGSSITVSEWPNQPVKSKLKFLANTLNGLYIDCKDVETDINMVGNAVESVTVQASNPKTSLVFHDNTYDRANYPGDNYSIIGTEYNGRLSIKQNKFKNSTSTLPVIIPSNCTFQNNEIGYNYENTMTASHAALRILSGRENSEVVGNKFITDFPAPRVMNIYISDSIVVKDNFYDPAERVTIAHSAGIVSNDTRKFTWDPKNKMYDLDSSTIPELGDFVFARDSIIRKKNASVNNGIGWVVVSEGTTGGTGTAGTFVAYGEIDKGIGIIKSGPTESRPSLIGLPIGHPYFDTTLGMQINKKNDTTWVDATGTTV